MANEAMRDAWEGDEGARWAQAADRYEAGSVHLRQALFEQLTLRETDNVLDIGCGNGGTTLRAARLVPQGSVMGIDLSSHMLAVAARRAAALEVANVAFEHADAQTHAFAPASFDVAISSFGVMFFDDPVAAFTNIAGALKSDGRIAFLVWRTLPEVPFMFGVRNALAIGRDLPLPPPDAPSPFALGDPERNASLLTAAGLTQVESVAVSEDMALGATPDDAFDFVSQMGMAKSATEALDEDQKRQAWAALREYLAGFQTADGVRIPAGAWIITARKP